MCLKLTKFLLQGPKLGCHLVAGEGSFRRAKTGDGDPEALQEARALVCGGLALERRGIDEGNQVVDLLRVDLKKKRAEHRSKPKKPYARCARRVSAM